MDAHQIIDLLSSSLSEIENLTTKLAKKESEGWEGSVRRERLKGQIRAVLISLRAEAKKSLNGDGI